MLSSASLGLSTYSLTIYFFRNSHLRVKRFLAVLHTMNKVIYINLNYIYIYKGQVAVFHYIENYFVKQKSSIHIEIKRFIVVWKFINERQGFPTERNFSIIWLRIYFSYYSLLPFYYNKNKKKKIDYFFINFFLS